jgi:hypothetical protein
MARIKKPFWPWLAGGLIVAFILFRSKKKDGTWTIQEMIPNFKTK